jgi:hypothetical protein
MHCPSLTLANLGWKIDILLFAILAFTFFPIAASTVETAQCVANTRESSSIREVAVTRKVTTKITVSSLGKSWTRM